MQEDPSSSLSPVLTAWPPLGERPWLWLCPCILGLWCEGALSCLARLAEPGWDGMGGDLPALVLLRVGLSGENRLLLKINIPKAVLEWWWML